MNKNGLENDTETDSNRIIQICKHNIHFIYFCDCGYINSLSWVMKYLRISAYDFLTAVVFRSQLILINHTYEIKKTCKLGINVSIM